MMWIKICANTNLADAQLAATLGANAIGFVFAPSKRQVTAAQVAEITPHLPATVEKIGVFTTTSPTELLEAAHTAGLTGIQLHSPFHAELPRTLKAARPDLRLIQVVDIPVGESAETLATTLKTILAEPTLGAILLDASVKGTSGGTGTPFDWNAVAPIVREVFAAAGPHAPKLIIAGGLRTKNVTQAIHLFAPYGVDVASGTELSPGIKDPAKLKAFISHARSASR